MANTVIQPFGTGGTASTGTGIVNDLTTGGADKALSAAQGKNLNEKIQNAVHLPVMILVANKTGVSSSKYRKVLFDDIKFLDVSTRYIYADNTPYASIFYSNWGMFIIYVDDSNYLMVSTNGSNAVVVSLYKNGTAVNTSSASGNAISVMGLVNHNISFDFYNKRIIFTKHPRGGSRTVTQTIDISAWDFSGLTGNQVYFYKYLYTYSGADFLYSFVRLNDPIFDSLSIQTTPDTVIGHLPIYPTSSIISQNHTSLRTSGFTVTETISNTHKKLSANSTSAEGYWSFFGNSDPAVGSISAFGVKFKLLSGTPSFNSGGMATIYVLKPDGSFVSLVGFSPEIGTEYTLISKMGLNASGRTNNYKSRYAMKLSGTFECEVSEPFEIYAQNQLIGSETYMTDMFTGNIPFSASGVQFRSYEPPKSVSDTNMYYHLGELKISSGNVYMWNGTAWKQINNS